MSKILQEKINELFEATKDLRSLEEIKPYCESFNEWVNTHINYSHATLGTKLSAYGFYKKFKSIPLEQDKNAVSISKHNADGSVKGYELKHYATVLCGLDKEQWNERNQTTRVIDRLENSTEIESDRYLETTGKLLVSDDPHELAVGIIAATGRRPHEVIARAKFTAIPDKPYHVMFSGQGKKRGETPVFEIATLYPADYVIKALVRLRKEPSTQTLLKEVKAQFPKSEARQNVEIDNRRGQSLRRVVRAYFGDKGDNSPVLAFRHGEEQDNNKALRAAYAVLATERDCKGGYGAKILHASRILGHFTPKVQDDRALAKLATSAGYSDYYTAKPVGFPNAPQKPQKEKLAQIKTARVSELDFETLKELQNDWGLPNQQAVITRLIESHQQKADLGKELLEAKGRIAQLERQIKQLQEEKDVMKADMESNQNALVTINPSDLKTLVERVVEEKIREEMKKLSIPQATSTVPDSLRDSDISVSVKAAQSKSLASTPVKEITDWESKTNAELWATRAQGAASEKIRRSFEVICLYNDTLATGDNDRLAITNQALRDLSGVNGLLVGDWIKAHADEIISHHSKYGMQNSKDHSKVETYYNKRHGQQKIREMLSLINEKFLDGAAKV